MNGSDFENELRALRPAPPAGALADHIERELFPQPQSTSGAARAGVIRRTWPQRHPWFAGLGWASAGAAALWLATAWLGAREGTPTPLGTEATPAVRAETGLGAAETSSELLAATEEELLLNEEQEPARRIRFTSLETHTWTDPETGALIVVEVPREDLLLVPIALQ